MPDQLVVTPGGYRPASQVHLVQPGQVVDGSGGRLRVLDSTGKLVTDFGPVPQRPAAPASSPSHVLLLKDALLKYPGMAVAKSAKPNSNATVPGPEAPGLGTGWIIDGDWTSTGVITSFTTKWVVPPPPLTQSGQYFYLFNGIQNSIPFILQPVLQWGSTPAGGGNSWAVASWYVDGQGGLALHSNLTQVQPGTVLTGVITLTGQSSAGFSYNCQFAGISNSIKTVQNIQELTWFIQTLEAYGMQLPTDYPNTTKTTMTAIAIKTSTSNPSLTWQPQNRVTDLGQHAVVVSDANPGGEVDLYYYSFNYWNWSAQRELTDRATSASPALASSGILCMAWKGVGQNNIWVSVSKDNGTTWSPQRELTDRATQDGPALTVVGDKFVMAWRGLGQNNIWVATSPTTDGLNWSPQTELGDRSTSAGPALASIGGKAVMAWKGTGQNNIWVSTSTDGIHWSGQIELTDRSSQSGPALAAGGGKYAMAWRGLDQNNIWVSTSTDGIHWTSQRELTDRSTNANPAITYSDSLALFYMAWQGSGQKNIWVSTSSDGETWTPQAELQDRSTNSGPALCQVAKTFYMAWQGSGQNNIWTSIFI